ncbi:OLC1v1019958C1 [Oldenlandia corymbosa var. corymbosa]|uniref:OLC1v1019958C1 n=1 Tax=Oldenlandia corymbosa var. corymbosa TaxID=529605 RepID=A0AAV1EFC6_OLDCO|nr:OLC1v1019958C1 [Oldenlandia corymbosa var. corymbosa]
MVSVQSMKKLPSEEDALAFISEIKQATYDHPNQETNNKFDQFAGALLAFEEQRITPECLILKLKSLFQGHNDLLRGLKFFCPNSRNPAVTRITLKIRRSSESEAYQRELCHRFLNEVKERFQDKPRNYYKDFLDALINYRNQTLDIDEFCQKIVELLFGHADLLHKFQSYFDDRDEKFRQEVDRHCGFAIDDRLVEIEASLGNLRTSIGLIEKASRRKKLSKVGRLVEREFQGIKVLGIKKTFPERSYQDVIQALKRDPFRVLPMVLDELREKEREVLMVRSSALKFLGEIHSLHRTLDSKKRGRDQMDSFIYF